MKKINIKNSDNALVGIVAAFLIMGLIVAVLAVVQTVYVPKWMEQTEADHMDKVGDQFSQLKYSIDTHTATKQRDTPISTSITLGSKELPYLMSVRSFGNLEILNKSCTVIINKTDGTKYTYKIGTIRYSSNNAYFVDQSYVYECGAVILSQTNGNTVLVNPVFNVQYEKNVSITFNIVNISTIGGKRAISGFGTYPIQTEYLDLIDEPVIQNISNITIKTEHTNAWHAFFNRTLIGAGLNYNGYGTNYTINSTDDRVIVEFNNSTFVDDYLYINIDPKVIVIGAQIAPGWIENR